MEDLFVYGTLCHKPLLELVAGGPVKTVPARMPGFRVHWAAGQNYPLIAASEGNAADGLLLVGLTEEQRDRLDFFEAVFDYYVGHVCVVAEGETRETLAYVAKRGGCPAGEPWSLEQWKERYETCLMRGAEDIMMAYGIESARRVRARLHMIWTRTTAFQAAQAQPSALTPSGMTAADVVTHRHTQPYANYFAVDERDLSFKRHDGACSEVVNRGTFMAADAVIVLPYDPVRDRVLLIEQFRAGPYFRGDPHCWVLEPIAGRIDPGDTAVDTVHREAEEEANLTLRDLICISSGYPSPGCSSEYYHLYLGIADLPDGITGVAGLAGEAEDIRSHLFSFDQLMEMVRENRISAQPAITLALWLAMERDRLRQTG